jgi:Uma2 family endonuclease
VRRPAERCLPLSRARGARPTPSVLGWEAVDLDQYSEPVPVPRGGVRFPLELALPEAFRADDPTTWPSVAGRLEFTRGRLWLMPPCGDDQQDVAASLLGVLEPWSVVQDDFVVGANEAGMILGGEVRAAVAAVWSRTEAGPRTGGYRRTAPVLAVEVAGRDEAEDVLRDKARWYLDRGVAIVWIVLPATRVVVVIDRTGESRFGMDEAIAQRGELPGLVVDVKRLFRQL